LAAVALPLALLTTTAHGSTGAKPGATVRVSTARASLLSTSHQPSGHQSPSVSGRVPHGYSLVAGLHLRVTPTVTPPAAPIPPAKVAVRPGPAPAPRGVPVAPARGTVASPRMQVTPVARPVAVVRTVPVPGPVRAAAGRSLGVFVITCYDLTGRTASGAGTSLATVAVDPSVIPLGATIYIQGVGTRVAQDTGGAIVGHRLDLWEPSYASCLAWGVQSRQVSIAD